MTDGDLLTSGDPIPGDPDQVRALGDRLVSVANQVGEQSARLRGVDADRFWTGVAADRFVADKDDLPPLLDLVKTRYSAAGSALHTYAPLLAEAKELAREAHRQAQAAQADIEQASRGERQMDEYASDERIRVRTAASAFPDRPAPHPVPWSGPNYHLLKADAQHELQQAYDKFKTAQENRDAAGRAAARAVAAASHDDIANTWHSRLATAARWVTENFPIEELSTILGAIAAIASVVALLIPPTAAFLGPVAAVAGGIKLALDVLLWAADDFSAKRGVDVVISLVLVGASAGLGALARNAHSAVVAADVAARGRPIVAAADDLARASRFAARARAFDAARGMVDRIDDLNDVRGIPDDIVDLRNTYDIYRSHPLLFTTSLPFGPMSGPVMAAWVYHHDHRVAGSSIAPIDPIPERSR